MDEAGAQAMELVSWAFAVFIIAAPICAGAYMLLFRRRWSVDSLRCRKALWKTGCTDFDVKVGQVYAVVIGVVLMIGGLIAAAQLLF